MRLLVIALLATACGREEPRRLPETRAPGSPVVVAPARVILAPDVPSSRSVPSSPAVRPSEIVARTAALLVAASTQGPTAANAQAPTAANAQAPAAANAQAPAASNAQGPAVAAADPREATRKAAHDALAEHCGSCHEGHRSTNAKALAVYDLDKPDWPSRFDDERRSQGALKRLASRSDAARDAFIAFRDAERAVATRTH